MDDKLLHDLQILTDLMEQDGWKAVRVASADFCVNLSDFESDQQLAGIPAKGGAAAEDEILPATEMPPLAALPPVGLDPDWLEVKAPNLGTFYRSPKPGVPPFVEVGDRVQSGAELCLIEVMKLFTSVRAEVGGTIRHIAASDAELVEGGQPLMYIECN